jgi:hypothetical protein
MSGVKRSRKATTTAVILIVSLVICFSDFARLVEPMRAATPVQLVRLSVSVDSGMVRIEITADGSFNDLAIEHFTRGRESVIRVRGARSLLHPSYPINESLAHGVRTVAGERDGEPFVDVIITMGEGATLAQKRSFNRFIIGIASDFARLRRRATTPATGVVAEARRPSSAPREVLIASAPVTDSIPAAAPPSYQKAASTVAQATLPAYPAAPSSKAATASANLPVFRGRTIWSNFTVGVRPFSRIDISRITPSFLQTPASMLANSLPTYVDALPMTLDPPGRDPGVWVPGTTAARRDDVGGRPFGGGVLRPSGLFSAEFDDNFFYRSKTGRNMGVFTFAPRLEFEVPGEERALRVAYEPRLRRLTNGHWANGHVLDFDSRVNVSPSFRFAFRNHFVRSPLDPREYDPARETYIVGDTFTRNDAAARAQLRLNDRNRLAFDLGYNIVRWKESDIAHAPLFINYDELSSSVTYERDISERTTATAALSFSNTLSSAPLRPQFDGLSDRQRYAFELGARTQLTEMAGLAFRVGYERSLFRHAPRENNFSGLIFDLMLRRDLTKNMNLELSALRKTQVSTFNLEGGNARLVSTGGALRVENTFREALKLGLGLNYQRLGFPVAVIPGSTASGGVPLDAFAGERRTDHLYGFSLDASYKWSDLLRMRFVYNFSRRDSTLPVLTFNSNRLSLIFEFGRRNDVRGRPF